MKARRKSPAMYQDGGSVKKDPKCKDNSCSRKVGDIVKSPPLSPNHPAYKSVQASLLKTKKDKQKDTSRTSPEIKVSRLTKSSSVYKRPAQGEVTGPKEKAPAPAPARPVNDTPDPKSKLQIKTKSGSWMDVDSHSKDLSKVTYSNVTETKPDPSRLRSVPVGGSRSKNR